MEQVSAVTIGSGKRPHATTYNPGQKSLVHLHVFVLAFYTEVGRNQQFTLIEIALGRLLPRSPQIIDCRISVAHVHP